MAIAGPSIAATLALGATETLAGKADDTINWATDREVSVIDPYYNNTRELVIMGHLAWDGLMFLNLETGEYEPLLATSWEWIDDTTLELNLREGVTFHDGSTFGPEDVVYTVNHVSNPDNGVLTQANVNWMQSAEQTGPNTVRIKLREPFPAALAYLANAIFILPAGNYDEAPAKADGSKDFGSVDPVGTGPYKFSDARSGEYVLWEKNESYMEGTAKGEPSIGKIRFRTIKEMNTQMAELMTGALDWVWDVPKDQAERLAGAPNVTVENAPTMRFSYITFDVQGKSGQDFFTDQRVRQAVAHAINRQAIVENMVGEASVVIDSACHPDQFGCAQDIQGYEYDPEKAKKLLADAGYPDGFETDIYAYRQREYTEAVIGDLAKVGIEANLNFLQYNALRDLIRNGETPMAHMTWGSNSIPDTSASTGQFFTGTADDPANDAEVKALVEKGNTSIDGEERKQAYREALSIITEKAYWLPMFTYSKYYAWSADLSFEPTSDEIPRFYQASWK
jgi:peptide/nickel transport system substrate-binding protein